MRAASSTPFSVMITKCARDRFSESGICRARMAAKRSSVMPSRARTRAFCTEGDALTTSTASQRLSFELSNSSGTSRTTDKTTATATATATAKPPAQQLAVLSPSPMTPTTTTQSVAVAEPKTLSGEEALKQMYDQRNAKRKVRVTLTKDQLVIGKDALEFSVQSDRGGYVYAALAGSDGKALYMLFPNDLDQNNRIEAGQTLKLPQGKWRIKSSGPVGTNHLLVMVADAPRYLQALSAKKEGPFMTSLNDANGRAQLGALLTSSKAISTVVCQNAASAKNNPLCSDAYGASLLSIKEVP